MAIGIFASAKHFFDHLKNRKFDEQMKRRRHLMIRNRAVFFSLTEHYLRSNFKNGGDLPLGYLKNVLIVTDFEMRYLAKGLGFSTNKACEEFVDSGVELSRKLDAAIQDMIFYHPTKYYADPDMIIPTAHKHDILRDWVVYFADKEGKDVEEFLSQLNAGFERLLLDAGVIFPLELLGELEDAIF